MQNPRVTIGVRFHRGGNEDWLHQALDSVQKQTYPHYHTILLIDGEEVFAEDLAKRFGKPYLCTNVHPHISHMSQLHRMGLGSCQTEFYKPLDFDDQLFPEYLEYAVQKMDSLNLDLYSCRMKHLCGGVIKNSKWPHSPIDRISQENCIPHLTVLLRTEAALKAGNYAPVVHANEQDDYFFWIRMQNSGAKLYREDSRWDALYRVHENQSTKHPERFGKKDKVAFCINSLGLGGAEVALISWVNELTEDLDIVIFVKEKAESIQSLSKTVRVIHTPPEDILAQLVREKPDTFVVDNKAEVLPLLPYIRKRVGNLCCIMHSINPWTQQFITPKFLPLWDKVILISPTEYNKAILAGVSENKLLVIENLVHTHQPLDRETARKQLGIPRNSFVFGYAGRACGAKRTSKYPQVLKMLRERGINAHLLMAGLVQEGLGERTEYAKKHHAEFLSEIAKFELSLHTHQIPPTADLSVFYGALDAGLLLSEFEGASLFQAESLFAGVPFISTAVGDASEWCFPFTGSFIIPNNADPLPAVTALAIIAQRSPEEKQVYSQKAIEMMTRIRGLGVWRGLYKQKLLGCLRRSR